MIYPSPLGPMHPLEPRPVVFRSWGQVLLAGCLASLLWGVFLSVIVAIWIGFGGAL